MKTSQQKCRHQVLNHLMVNELLVPWVKPELRKATVVQCRSSSVFAKVINLKPCSNTSYRVFGTAANCLPGGDGRVSDHPSSWHCKNTEVSKGEREVQEEKRACWFTGFLNQISSLSQCKLAVFPGKRRRQIDLVHQMQEVCKLQEHLNYFSVIFSKQPLKVCCVLLMCCMQQHFDTVPVLKCCCIGRCHSSGW